MSDGGEGRSDYSSECLTGVCRLSFVNYPQRGHAHTRILQTARFAQLSAALGRDLRFLAGFGKNQDTPQILIRRKRTELQICGFKNFSNKIPHR